MTRVGPGRVPAAPRLHGRDGELGLLARVRSDLQAGDGSIVAVEGSPGVGKTALVATHAVATADCHVVWVRATEIDRLRSFGCLVDALDCRLQHPSPAHRRVAEAMVASIEAVADPFRFDTDVSWRFPVQDAIVDLFLEFTASTPTMLVLDDVQWADPATMGVLQALARRCSSERLGIIWTRRSGHPVRACDEIAVRNPSRFTLIDVQPLQPAAARAMGIDVFGGELDPDTLDKLDRAAGIPFFIEAAIHGAHASTPDEAISHRVSQLPVATSEVMSLAAVIGGGFDLTTIAVLADRSVRDIVRAVEPAIERGLVRSTGGGGYEFVHDLIRAAVLEDLPPPLRTPLHREIAEALATAGAESSVVAHHLVNGARPGDEDVAERIRSLCDDVVRRDAALAAELLDRASRLCRTGSPTWAATTADRVVALQWAGRAADALDLANESVTIPMPPAESARMRISRATSLGLVNDLVASADEYRRILDEGGLDDVTRAQVTAELATLDAWGVDRGRARESIDAAVATARTAGATQAELQSLCARSTIELFDGQVGAAVASARAAVERGRGFAGLAPARELYLGLALAGADEHEESDFWFRSGHAAAEAISDLWLVSRYQLAWMAVRLNTGDWEPAMVDAEAVITLHQDTGMGTGMPQAPAIAGIIAIRRGAPPGVIARYRALSAQNAAEGAEPSGLLYAGWFEGLVAEHEGRTDDALATLETLDAMVADSAPLVRMWVAPDLIRVLLDSGESERAVQLVRSLSPFAERMGVASALGTVRLCAGLVAVASGDGHAWALLTDAADLLLGARWKPLAAVALDALSQLNPTRRDDRQRILRSELGIASNDPRGHGRSESASRSDPRSTLTPVERTVAELVADGLANARIAVRLGISKRTVEYHVSNLYMKLGVTNRVAVASLIRSR